MSRATPGAVMTVAESPIPPAWIDGAAPLGRPPHKPKRAGKASVKVVPTGRLQRVLKVWLAEHIAAQYRLAALRDLNARLGLNARVAVPPPTVDPPDQVAEDVTRRRVNNWRPAKPMTTHHLLAGLLSKTPGLWSKTEIDGVAWIKCSLPAMMHWALQSDDGPSLGGSAEFSRESRDVDAMQRLRVSIGMCFMDVLRVVADQCRMRLGAGDRVMLVTLPTPFGSDAAATGIVAREADWPIVEQYINWAMRCCRERRAL